MLLNELFSKAKVLNATTCLDFKKNNLGELKPINVKKTFSTNDKHILLYLEFEQMIHDCPINIVISDNQKQKIYSDFEIIAHSKNSASNFHCTYIYEIRMNKDLDPNIKMLNIEISFLNGQIIYDKTVNIVHKQNSHYNLYANKHYTGETNLYINNKL
ncbi:hypothetical protein [Clostridium tepidiprofundi]|uniref:hypothetical protein n=1 Tax=Clostridium tepidiprofundi TaxID=420412 RepID=UPI00082BB80F|nr:hypothetical protein [Clostridium tepidiprofundi]